MLSQSFIDCSVQEEDAVKIEAGGMCTIQGKDQQNNIAKLRTAISLLATQGTILSYEE